MTGERAGRRRNEKSAARAYRRDAERGHIAAELAAVYAWSGPRLRRGIVRAARRIGAGSGFDGLLRLAAEDPDRGVRQLALRSRRPAR